MKILFISVFPPNQKTAGQDYTRRLILDLLDKGHSVSIFYAEYPNHPIELPSPIKIEGILKPSVLNCIKKLMFHPFFTRRFDKSILSKIQAIASGFDIIYFDFSQVHIYSLYVNHPCKVLMCHDVICQKYTRKGRVQLPWIKYSEKKFLKTASKIITFSKKDSLVIKNAYNLDSVSVNFYLKNGKFDYSNKIRINREGNSTNLFGLKKLLSLAYTVRKYKEKLSTGKDTFSVEQYKDAIKTSKLSEKLYLVSNKFLYKAINCKAEKNIIGVVFFTILSTKSPYQIAYLFKTNKYKYLVKKGK